MYGRVRVPEKVEVSPAEVRADDAVSVEELEDARLGFFRAVSRLYGGDIRERFGDDCFAQAAFEFSRKVEQGEEIRNPAAWITHCALNRVRDDLAAIARRPRFVPTESLLAEPVAEPSWQPEEVFFSEDRMRRVREAVDQLPAYQRELIARAYFEEESVREASRNMGWSEGKGARAHNAARKRLRKLLGPEFDLKLPPVRVELGLAAFFSASAAGRRTVAQIPGGLEAALERAFHAISDGVHKGLDVARHPLGGADAAELSDAVPQAQGRISLLGRRLFTSPVVETAATAGDGPGRFVEVCKALAVCAVSGTAVTAGIITAGGGHQDQSPPPIARPMPRHQGDTQVPHNARADHDDMIPPAVGHPVVEADPSGARRSSGGMGGEKTSVAHSISMSRAAPASGADRGQRSAEEEEANEKTASREAFSAFEGRGEEEPDGAGSTGADAQSLSPATTPTVPAESAPGPASSTPKESAEKKAAGEEFQGGLR